MPAATTGRFLFDCVLDADERDVIICMMVQVSKRQPLTPKQAAACAGPMDDLLDADFFKALGDPTRLRLLACLAKCGRGCSLGEVAECCSVDLSVVSRHMSLLERAGIVESKKVGRSVLFVVKYASFSSRFRLLADAVGDCCPDGACTPKKGGRGACCG